MATRLLPLVALIVGAVSLLLASGERPLEPWSPPPASADDCAVSPAVGASQPPNGLLTAAFNAAGFNGLFPGHQYFGLTSLEAGPARGLRQPYIPPTLLKAIGWIEATWRQADGGAPLISFDCGYGIMQITSPGVFPLEGVGMVQRSTDTIYYGAQVPIATSYTHNIAFGAKTLIAKWNYAPVWRPVVGNSDPSILEDWYYAVWSYNGFVPGNHPGNHNPLRGEYSCNVSDGFNHNRTQFPYQELVLGCVKHPPVESGVALWSPIPVTLPPSVPSFSGYGEGMDIPTPQPAHRDPTSGTQPSPVAIDAPAGTAVQPFGISGWAADYAAPSGTGIDTVHVYAYPSDPSGAPTGDPVFLGYPALGGWRPDVATTFGNPDFASAGYSLTVCGVQGGFYLLAVAAHSTVTGDWYWAQRVVQVLDSGAMALDAPPRGTAEQPFTVSGWAIDCATGSGSGVDAVHVYAYPSDSSGAPTGPPALGQAAGIGVSRLDVGAAYGSQFNNSGYSLEIRGLPSGYYHLAIYAHSKVTGVWNDAHRVIWVAPPPMMVDTPSEGSSVQQPFQVSGWAIDQSATSGTGVDAVHVYAYPSDSSGAPTGPPAQGRVARYGVSRPGVGAAYGSRFNNSGYSVDIIGLSPGYYHLVVYAHSTATGDWNDTHRVIQVAAPPMTLDVPSAGSTVRQPFRVAGWAIDQSAASGTGVDAVHVYAYPSDSSGAPPGPPALGRVARYGVSRTGVGAAYGSRFNNSGYSVDITGLPAGHYHLVVYAHSTATGDWNEAHRVIRVPTPLMALDALPAGSTVRQPFQVAGWAIDHAAASGTGVDAVHVYAYPSDSSGAPTGPPALGQVAGYGVSRPDVGAVYGSRFTNSGYSVDIAGLPAGYYHLVVYARSTVTGTWNDSHRVIQVR